jgi:mannosyltransferase OCH1-like enzyme
MRSEDVLTWTKVMWTDEDNARLVDTRFAHLADVYRSLRSDIQRADFARNLYMWEYGG